jgi:hypothetical protein
MIRGHVALIRLLRGYMEGSNLPWSGVEFNYERDEDGREIYDDHRAEIAFPCAGKRVEVVIIAPSDDRDAAGECLPLGKLAGRIDGGQVIKGPIDQSTWDQIVKMIRSETDAGLRIACA